MSLLLSPNYGATVLCYSRQGALGSKSGAWAAQWSQDFAGPPLSQLVVCTVQGEQGCYLLGLDPQGHVVFDSQHSSTAEAKQYAEAEYPAVREHWLAPG